METKIKFLNLNLVQFSEIEIKQAGMNVLANVSLVNRTQLNEFNNHGSASLSVPRRVGLIMVTYRHSLLIVSKANKEGGLLSP